MFIIAFVAGVIVGVVLHAKIASAASAVKADLKI